MKIVPLLMLVVMAVACGSSYRLNVAKMVADVERIRDEEAKYYAERRRYASLQELVDAGLVGKELADGKDAGFFFELNASTEQYSLSVFPDYSQGVVKREDQQQWSIYCDQTGILRGTVNPNKRADARSDEIHPKH